MHQVNSDATKTGWLTPLSLIQSLGEFDLDPCCPQIMPWRTAHTMFRYGERDGLNEPWFGRVWLNPPYGRQARDWIARLRDHGNGIALIPPRTGTAWFYKTAWSHADAICFVRGRIAFCLPDGTPAKKNNAPSCLVAYGANNVEALHRTSHGVVVKWERKC